MMKNRLFVSGVILAVAVGICMTLLSGVSKVNASFTASNIIDDYIFNNAGALNASQINAFLNQFPSSCISPNNGFGAVDPTGYSPTTGFTYGGTVSAGQVIYDAANAYGLNPEVLLTTLQKEQSLVTGGGSCGVLAYTAAAGYGCPDGGTTYSYSGLNLYSINGIVMSSVNGTCVNTSAKAGFSQQVIRAAWLLKFSQQRSEGNMGWAVISGSWNNSDDLQACYTGPMTTGYRKQCPNGSSVYYDGYTTIDGQSVHMDDGATAALYFYTPHFSGNQHFDTIFQSWFGPTIGDGFQRVISDDPNDTRQWVVYDGVKQYIPSTQMLNAWGLENINTITMPAAQLAAITTGPNLDRLMELKGTSTIYFVDNGQRYRVPWNTILASWGINNIPVATVSAGLFSLPVDNGTTLTYAIKDPNSSTVYMPDGVNGSNQTILRAYANVDVLGAWEGSYTNYFSPSSDFFSTINKAIGSPITGTTVVAGGANYQVVNGYRMYQPSNLNGIYTSTPQSVSWATISRLSLGPNVSDMIWSPQGYYVFLVDNNVKYHLYSGDIENAWSAQNQQVTVVNNAFLNLIVAGSDITNFTASNGGSMYLMNQSKLPIPSKLTTAYTNIGPVFTASSSLLAFYNTGPTLNNVIQSNDAPNQYIVTNSGNKEWLPNPQVGAAWGDKNGITVLSYYILRSIISAPNAPSYVSDGSTFYYLDNGNKWSATTTVANAWGLSGSQQYTDGTLGQLTNGGTLGTAVRDSSGAYFTILGGTGYATTDANIANSWGLSGAPLMSTSAVTNQMTVYMLTRFVRSSVQGDPRLFLVDNGTWYTINVTQLTNMGGWGTPVMYLDPKYAGSITAWQGAIVKDSSNNYYVMDNGSKRPFSSTAVYNQWTNSGALSVPTMSAGFLNSLNTGGSVGLSIKGVGPGIFAGVNGQEDLITNPSTYNQTYAPYTSVSDALINSLSAGPNIN